MPRNGRDQNRNRTDSSYDSLLRTEKFSEKISGLVTGVGGQAHRNIEQLCLVLVRTGTNWTVFFGKFGQNRGRQNQDIQSSDRKYGQDNAVRRALTGHVMSHAPKLSTS